MISATYDPADNKIRLRASARLDHELYLRVKAAGFAWAPKQEIFVASAWTPERENLALELAGELGDEDTSLVDRAEERAERFVDYQEKRADEAGQAHAAVDRIADGIPMGQPILVGHHSERRARKDAEKIQHGMRRAVRLWETSQYWEQRAKGALRNAQYKELPAVRHRRIKGLEADLRKQTKERQSSLALRTAWEVPGLTLERALAIANFDSVTWVWSGLADGKVTVADAVEKALATHLTRIERAERWIAHLTNRLAYERALLGESGGIVVLLNMTKEEE